MQLRHTARLFSPSKLPYKVIALRSCRPVEVVFVLRLDVKWVVLRSDLSYQDCLIELFVIVSISVLLSCRQITVNWFDDLTTHHVFESNEEKCQEEITTLNHKIAHDPLYVCAMLSTVVSYVRERRPYQISGKKLPRSLGLPIASLLEARKTTPK